MFMLPRLNKRMIRAIGAILLTLTGSVTSIRAPAYARTNSRPSATRSGLTMDQRIRYQMAIEEVYWRHRIWPKENPQPKPPLEQVLPLSAIEAKVHHYLIKSHTIEVNWRRPITEELLRTETAR